MRETGGKNIKSCATALNNKYDQVHLAIAGSDEVMILFITARTSDMSVCVFDLT